MRAFLALSFLLLASFGVRATTSFGYSGEPFDIQFVGRDFQPAFNGVVEVSTKTGPHMLPSESYNITSYTFGKSLRLQFLNKDYPELPPSFILTVTGNDATLEVGGSTTRGYFSWDS